MSEAKHEQGRLRVKAEELRQLSDEEFVDQLRATVSPRGWTVGQLVELERRGTHLVEEDASVAEAYEQYLERSAELRHTLGTAFSEYDARAGTAAEEALGRFSSIAETTAAEALGRFSERWNSVSTRLEDVALSFPETDLPGVSSLALSPTPEVLNIPPPPSLEMQVAQLEALSEIRREIQNLTKRDWVEWLTLGLVAAAALASVITVLRNW